MIIQTEDVPTSVPRRNLDKTGHQNHIQWYTIFAIRYLFIWLSFFSVPPVAGHQASLVSQDCQTGHWLPWQRSPGYRLDCVGKEWWQPSPTLAWEKARDKERWMTPRINVLTRGERTVINQRWNQAHLCQATQTNLLEKVHEVSDEVSLAQQKVSPHGLKMFQQLVVLIQHIQKILTGLKICSINLTLKGPFQISEQFCRWERYTGC